MLARLNLKTTPAPVACQGAPFLDTLLLAGGSPPDLEAALLFPRLACRIPANTHKLPRGWRIVKYKLGHLLKIKQEDADKRRTFKFLASRNLPANARDDKRHSKIVNREGVT
jgi:hypothetical protein